MAKGHSKLLLPLKSASLIRATLALVLGCVAIQVALGANLLVVSLALIACTAGLAGVRIVGAYQSGAWLAFLFVLGNVTVALVAKTVLFQPLDSNLYAPVASFVVLAAGSAALLIALIISLILPVGKPVLRSIKDLRLLRFLSTSTFALGTVFWFLARLFQDPGGSGFGGITVFWNLLLMSVIARAAMIIERTHGRRSVDTILVMILLACVVMGMIDNSKAEVALPIVAYFATSLFYNGGLTFRQCAAGTLGVLLMVTLIGPMIHAYRALGIHDMPWRERVGLMERSVKDALVHGDVQFYQEVVSEVATMDFGSGYYDYFGRGTGQMLLGRYASIQQIDPVIATVNRRGFRGGSVIWPAFQRVTPTFLFPAKPRDTEGFLLLVQLGISDPEGNKYPVVPLLAQSYAAYGATGVLVIPFFVFLCLLLAMKKLGWHLYRNVFAIFFFCVYLVVYANQGEMNQYAEAVLRNFPLLAISLWLITFLFRAWASAGKGPRQDSYQP
jgi:hypothetical protein